MKKQSRLIFSLVFILLSNLVLGINGMTVADAGEISTLKSVDGKIVIENPGSAVSDGKYIYYAYQGDGKRMDIIKLDLKTLKSKSIAKKTGNSYTNLSIKGNYIYAALDKANGYGVGNEEPYIYRISKDGKHKEKLAVGESPVIAGNKIYYYSGEIVKFESVGQFRNFIKTIQYLGLRKSNLIGTVKIHGTNSSVGLDLKDNSLFCQSRNRVLSLDDDNYDFVKYIEDNKSEFLKIFNEIKNKNNTENYDSIIIYGE